MSTKRSIVFRKIIIIAVVGFFVGALGGTAFSYVKRLQREPSVSPTPSDSSLGLRCTGDANPRIVVSWEAKLTPALQSLERSVDGGSWKPVFTGSLKPTKSGYQDTDVMLDKAYQYRFRVAASAPFVTAEIRTSRTECASN